MGANREYLHNKDVRFIKYNVIYARMLMEIVGFAPRWWELRRIQHFNLLQAKEMKLTYLWQKWNYKPEYDIADFTRVNCMEDYNPVTVLKLMQALYPIRLRENRPEYMEEILDSNDM